MNNTHVTDFLLILPFMVFCVTCANEDGSSSISDAGEDTRNTDVTVSTPWLGDQDAQQDLVVDEPPDTDAESDTGGDPSADPGVDLSAVESDCGDGVDNDGDGATDCDDGECDGDPVCSHETDCGDWEDNDRDGFPDCSDPGDCQSQDVCQSRDDAGPTGAPCTEARDCASANGQPACITEDYFWPGGYCQEFCDVDAQDCPDGAICFDPGYRGSLGVCMDLCDPDTDPCRDDTMVDPYYGSTFGYMCDAMPGLAFDVTVCIPDWYY